VETLLHLDSSANRSGESVARQLTALFADTWRARHDPARYRYRAWPPTRCRRWHRLLRARPPG
jgi:hypothetical protein